MSILVSLCLLKIEIVRDMNNEAGKHRNSVKFTNFLCSSLNVLVFTFEKIPYQLKEQLHQSTHLIRD